MAGVAPTQGRVLLESGDFSDFSIICKGREIIVHKVLLASASGFFRILLRSELRV